MYGIAIDLGTSGFRLQLIDLESGLIYRTIITMKHPLPGGNVIDHLGFAINAGEDVANEIMVTTLKKMFKMLPVQIEKVKKIAVCGNPIQLSLIQNIEIRDLAYAGRNMQERLGISKVERGLKVYDASQIFGAAAGFKDCELIVLPSIEHEIGADALAMMIKTDFMEQKSVALVTDYGTNAEMALKVGNKIITCSAAAGPAIEGQGIKCGMLASPGAISDINEEGGLWRLMVLDEHMNAQKSHLIDPLTGIIEQKGEIVPKGITGTGVISAISIAICTGIIKTLPELPNGRLILGEGIELTDKDIAEAGKAIGAIRAAHLTLLIEAGIRFEELEYMYMSGASGTYVDANKARKIGLAPRFAKHVVQFGNTSLELAKDIVLGNYNLNEIQALAERIKANHIMLASNDTFKDIYSCELAYWTEGMSEKMYDDFLSSYNIQKIPQLDPATVFQKRIKKDIHDTDTSPVVMMQEMDTIIEEKTNGCIECGICENECPENAIKITNKDGNTVAGYLAHLCLGMSCKRCVRICPKKAIHYRDITVMSQQGANI